MHFVDLPPASCNSCSWTENRIWTQIWHLNWNSPLFLLSFPGRHGKIKTKIFLTRFHWFPNTRMYIFKRIILLKMYNVPQEGWRSPSVMAMRFSIFLSLPAIPMDPRLSWHQAVGCHPVSHSRLPALALTELQLQPGRPRAQGHQRWDRSSQLCPIWAWRAPGVLLSGTMQTYGLLLAVAEVTCTRPHHS